MRAVFTSDLHGQLPTNFPEGDVLVIAGDLCPDWDHDRAFQANWLKGHFRNWLNELPYDDIIFIGGNHDFVLQSTYVPVIRTWFDDEKFHYLQDDCVHIGGLCFYGTPWSSRFGKWAFMEDEDILKLIYSTIPEDVDILITHGPPQGAGDLTSRWGAEHVGSQSLTQRISEVEPKLVITGHIHEDYGQHNLGGVPVWNVSFMDVDYQPLNEAVAIDL